MSESLFTANVAGAPLNVTVTVPVSLAPMMLTALPIGPASGVTLLMTGTAMTLNWLELVAAPAGVVTVIGPVVAPAGTVVEICVSLLTRNVAVTPLNFTDVVPLKLLPLILTDAPGAAAAGKNPLIVGGPEMVKTGPVAVPAGVVTVTGPVVAPAGTVVAIDVSLLTRNDAATPLNATAVVPLKFVPKMPTEVDGEPDSGKYHVIVGGPEMVKTGPVAVPAGVVTVTGPVVAPAGTVVEICVSLLTMNDAAAPLNATAVVPLKFVPRMLTEVDGEPDSGK
ncbi:MAG TPA: hypothetical protein VMS98_09660 [Thermoanaerobaculia bacterium]|nr:hypothetical protein [Thermoanaerobaculia bacterium]